METVSMIHSELWRFPQRNFFVNFGRFFTYNFGLKWNFFIRKTATERSQEDQSELARFFGKIFFLTLKNWFFHQKLSKNEVFSPINNFWSTNVKGLWKIETSNFACRFTMEWTRDLVTAFYLFWVVFEKNAKKYSFM